LIPDSSARGAFQRPKGRSSGIDGGSGTSGRGDWEGRTALAARDDKEVAAGAAHAQHATSQARHDARAACAARGAWPGGAARIKIGPGSRMRPDFCLIQVNSLAQEESSPPVATL